MSASNMPGTLERLTALLVAHTKRDPVKIGELGAEILEDCRQEAQAFLIALAIMGGGVPVALSYDPARGLMYYVGKIDEDRRTVMARAHDLGGLVPAILRATVEAMTP